MLIPGSITVARYAQTLRRIFQTRGGEVEHTLIPEVQPTAGVIRGDEPEFQILKGSIPFTGRCSIGGVAGQNGIFEIYATEGHIAVVRIKDFTCASSTYISVNLIVPITVLPLGVIANVGARDSRRRRTATGLTVPGIGMYSQTLVLAAPYNTGPMEYLYHDAASPVRRMSSWYVLANGGGQLVCYVDTVNVGAGFTVEGYVRPLDPREGDL